jgi:hypothetical protein
MDTKPRHIKVLEKWMTSYIRYGQDMPEIREWTWKGKEEMRWASEKRNNHDYSKSLLTSVCQREELSLVRKGGGEIFL